MRLQFFFLQNLVLVLCYIRLTLAIDSSYHQVEQLDKVPDGWSRGDRPLASKLIKFQLAITQYNAGEFEQKVIELSTPDHVNYGQHMKRDEVQKLLSSSPAVSDQIIVWLLSENVPASSINLNGHWISFTVSISQVEKMLKTKFFYFHQQVQQTIAIRTLGYSVPRALHPYIQLILPTTRFGNLILQRRSTLEQKPVTAEQLAAGCNTTITPDCLRDLYGIDNTTTRPEWRNRLGISGFLEQYALHADFDEFLRHYAKSHTDSNFSVVTIKGGQDNQHSMSDSVEANLDVQYSISLADEVLATFYSTGGRGPVVPEINHPDPTESTNKPYLEQLHYFLNLSDENLPAVLSNSYGEDEQSLLPSYVNATCSLFAQLAARGVSILFSSGDEGPGSCVRNDGTNQTRSLPGYPASCPFVTAVGGTYGINPERAVYFSGGGFSEVFPRPQYQDQAVKGYFHHLASRWNGLYNATGRGYSDVSAQATSFIVRDHGDYGQTGFTDIVLGNSSGCNWTAANATLQLRCHRRVGSSDRARYTLVPYACEIGIVRRCKLTAYRSSVMSIGMSPTIIT
ncbi:Peptidase S8/S53 subtilisin/kexin/sedolisin [Penicillium fimorum]|uniref:tripeptidyl-peptidase II n=1 Tax=Penicillium fimorum TaxID=1882269 RepID=A0A9W9Y4U3_9EURO|nr:Peptidase S8/S53 subtilisin/kexin/sedolisin [Penicillium fimorum]